MPLYEKLNLTPATKPVDVFGFPSLIQNELFVQARQLLDTVWEEPLTVAALIDLIAVNSRKLGEFIIDRENKKFIGELYVTGDLKNTFKVF